MCLCVHSRGCGTDAPGMEGNFPAVFLHMLFLGQSCLRSKLHLGQEGAKVTCVCDGVYVLCVCVSDSGCVGAR